MKKIKPYRVCAKCGKVLSVQSELAEYKRRGETVIGDGNPKFAPVLVMFDCPCGTSFGVWRTYDHQWVHEDLTPMAEQCSLPIESIAPPPSSMRTTWQ